MSLRTLSLLLVLTGVCAGFVAPAQAYVGIDATPVIICPASDTVGPPDFHASACREATAADIDPQQGAIWVKATLNIPDTMLQSSEPQGLFISAKTTSRVYMNGTLLGENGVPSIVQADETPGAMDAVFFAPRTTLHRGHNELIVLMSSHHGWLHLSSPIHWIALGRYTDPADRILRYYWPSLILFGVLVLGAIYLGVQVLVQDAQRSTLLTPAMALLAAAQLFVEVMRGLLPYDYPFHDIRLVLLLTLSLSFALCLLAHVVLRFAIGRRGLIFTAGVVLSLAAILSQKGYDYMSAAAFLTPAALSTILVLYWSARRRPHARRYAAALLVFMAIIMLAPSQFLDTYFFYLVTALLCFLLSQQVMALKEAQQQHQTEKIRADRLQMVLDQSRDKDQPHQIKVTGAGKVDLVSTERIAYCKGAGDYVELSFIDGGSLLHSESLTELEKRMPATFLRVHRSYLVNTALIRSLERDSNSAGRLILSHGATVPVSRRIMPKVRQALA